MSSAKTHPYVPTQAYIPANDMVVVAKPSQAHNNYAVGSETHLEEARVIKPKYVHIQSRKPVVLTYCPNCGIEEVGTRTRTKSTGATWACGGLTMLVFWPLCWVPFVVDDAKQTDHYCVNCNQKVGRVKAFH